METDIRISLKRLSLKILVFNLLILGVLILLSAVFTTHFKQRLAEQLSEAFRAPLITGDNRQIILDMSRPVSKDFLGVIWIPQNGTYVFTLPEGFKKPNFLYYQAAVIRIFFDDRNFSEFGKLYFYYNRWASLPIAIISWIIIVFFSIILGHFEKKRIIREYNLFLQSRINESLATIAAQVAHDIRSPLAALDSVLKDIAHLPEEKRVTVRTAVNRIHDIANNLIEKYRKPAKDTAPIQISSKLNDYLLSALIAPVISEKRIQFASRPQVKIEAYLESAYGLFARIDAVEFKRIVSNLVNNAVESLDKNSTITVTLSEVNGNAVLSVQDNGKGIPADILAKLGRKGETHGKIRGSGLGLYHAKTSVEFWGGSLQLQSEVGKGTLVIIRIPKSNPPDWFVPQLDISAGAEVAVLDDDASIHQIWQGKFDSLNAGAQGIKIMHFYAPHELKAYKPSGKAIYLLDYELLGYKETGLSLAEELHVGERSMLVTSRYEEPHILENCKRLGIRLIPKGLAGFVPIRIVESSEFRAESIEGIASPINSAVLIDDDPLVHMTWKMAAKNAGVRLKAYKEPKEFLREFETISKNTSVYIDSELGDGIKGEDIAKTLNEKGFSNIYLETGHPAENFAHLSFIKKVISKEPPWG